MPDEVHEGLLGVRVIAAQSTVSVERVEESVHVAGVDGRGVMVGELVEL